MTATRQPDRMLSYVLSRHEFRRPPELSSDENPLYLVTIEVR